MNMNMYTRGGSHEYDVIEIGPEFLEQKAKFCALFN